MNTRNLLWFSVGFNAAIGTLCLWGYSVTEQGIFAATALACVICGATAMAGLKGKASGRS